VAQLSSPQSPPATRVQTPARGVAHDLGVSAATQALRESAPHLSIDQVLMYHMLSPGYFSASGLCVDASRPLTRSGKPPSVGRSSKFLGARNWLTMRRIHSSPSMPADY